MKFNGNLLAIACAALAVACTSTAHADGVCNAGYFNITAADRAVMLEVLEAGKRALPPAPEGWVLLGDDQVDPPTSLCGDVMRSPWYYQYTRHYQQVGNQAERDKIIADAGALQAAAMKQKQPRLDATMAKLEALSKRQVAFIEKGDLEHAAALNEDMAKLQDEYKAILDEGDSQQQFEAAAAKAGKDLVMTISIAVNDRRQTIDPAATNLPLPPGARAATRLTTSIRGEERASAVFLLGAWRNVAERDWQLASRTNVFTNKPHTITVRIDADPERIAPTIAAINFAALAVLLPK
jgi:hypothetical protein